LGRSVPLERALIFNRMDDMKAAGRAANLRLLLSDDAKTWREAYRHDGKAFGGADDGKPLAVALDGAAARFLRIQLPGTDYLHLDEVEVYGKDDPKKNIAIGRPADQSSISAWSKGVAKSPSPTAKRPAAQPEPALRLGLVRLDMEAEWQREFQVLAAQTADRRRQPPETEVYHRSAMILSDDRDGVDVVLRRTEALWADLAGPSPPAVLKHLRWRIDQLKGKAQSVGPSDAEARLKLFLEVCAVRRQIALANPLLDFNKLLFVKRHQGTFRHMVDQYYGDCAKPGGALCVLVDPFGPKTEVRDVLADATVQRGRLEGRQLRGGSFLSFDLSFDGQTVAFSWTECVGRSGHIAHTDPARGHWGLGRCYHVFRARTDGSQLEQLTDGTWNDFDPCWLPNGRIAFISERRGGYLRCGRYCPTYTMYDMAADGSDIRPLSVHETHEWSPSVTHDGRIIYTRWDYVDRDAMVAHLPWVTTLDGRDARAVHGNFSPRRLRPDMELNVRAIPGSHKFVATAAAHHGFAFGSLVVIDPRTPDNDGMGPVRRLTPDAGFPESQVPVGPQAEIYGTPWPLSETYFLCAYTAPPAGEPKGKDSQAPYGIYLVDAFGNRELIYRDDGIGSISPMPLRPRPMPPEAPSPLPRMDGDGVVRVKGTEQVVAVDGKPAEAVMAVVNVYDGLRPWPQGLPIKAIRIVHIVPQSVPSQDTYGGRAPDIGVKLPGQFGSVVLARNVIGTVPVEADGSAYFTVPAHKELFFQALDERGLAVQSMRSGTYAHPGETMVCAGCHDPKHAAPRPPASPPLALRRAASRPQPEAEGADPFSYPRLVQPVLDKHCVKCHTESAAEGKKAPNLAREPIVKGWYASYGSLVPKYAFCNYSPDQLRTTPGKFGARASKLLDMLDKGHHDLKLPAEDLRRITLWLDCCSIFYGVYEKESGAALLRGEIVKPTLE
ncbi:MAG: hypothetical protein ABR915_05585, partial [Thermoguttaceae bacterium]